MNAPIRPDRDAPEPAEPARIDATEEVDLEAEVDDGEDDEEDDGLSGLDKTLADSFPASDPPQAP